MAGTEFLADGRRWLEEAPDRYGRALSSEEYWWLGVGLAATTLAELGERGYAAGRIEQLVERLGHKGAKGDWLQRFVEELAALDAEGLLWPVYQRSDSGTVEATGLAVRPEFGPKEAHLLALAHIAVALAVHREEPESVARLAAVVRAAVEFGLTPEDEAQVVAALAGTPEA